jgi:23S rRNA (cytidine1920-2'-O)/16S rRNA (cytidine1409-2'-O)-methyltransferase
MKKERLDKLMQQLLPHLTRNQIASFIMQGKVTVDGTVTSKAGALINPEAHILCDIYEPKYVSRAGFKLERALEHFILDVNHLIALDAGLSTGGFTDCLLKNGIKHVYGVDVGYGQVHEKIRNDERVTILERTNLRELSTLPPIGTTYPQRVDLVTLDLSFISVLKVIPAVINLMNPNAQLIVLIKPQFEAERSDIGRGGIVRDPHIHQKVIERITTGLIEYNFSCIGVIESPIEGATGNKEFLGYFKRIQ